LVARDLIRQLRYGQEDRERERVLRHEQYVEAYNRLVLAESEIADTPRVLDF